MQASRHARQIRSLERAFLELILLCGISSFVLAISFIVGPMHIAGDQIHYSKAYEMVSGKGFLAALANYRRIIFADEVGHFVVIWIAAQFGFGKIIFMSFLNSALSVLYCFWLRKKGFSRVMALFLVGSNYYLYAMFFTLERLKIATIFLLLFVALPSSSRLRNLFPFLSAFSHIQTAIFSGLIFLSRLVSRASGVFFRHLVIIAIVGLSICILEPPQFFYEKISYYTELNSIRSAYIPSLVQLIFFPIFVYCSKDRIAAALFYFVLMIFVAILGGDRLNMFFYFGFIYFSRERSFLTKLVLATSSFYFTFKIVNYINLIYTQGG